MITPRALAFWLLVGVLIWLAIGWAIAELFLVERLSYGPRA